MNDFGKDKSGCNGSNFADYLSAELNVQSPYADLKGEICNSRPSNEDGGNVEPTRTPALAIAVESLNILRSFVEYSGGNSVKAAQCLPTGGYDLWCYELHSQAVHIDY